jgi:hypothetical protein
VTDGKRRTLREWREARKLTHEGAMRVTGVHSDTLKEWERTGYPTRQGGPGKAIQLAETFRLRRLTTGRMSEGSPRLAVNSSLPLTIALIAAGKHSLANGAVQTVEQRSHRAAFVDPPAPA